MPNLEQIAEQGIVFSQAYCDTPQVRRLEIGAADGAHVRAGIDASRYARLESGIHGAEDRRPPERRGMGADSNR